MTLKKLVPMFAAIVVMGLLHGTAPARTQAGQVFGALVYNNETDAIGWAYNFADSDDAEKTAMKGCLQKGQGCYVVITFSNSCAAVAVDKGSVVYSIEGANKDEAQSKVMDKCQKGGNGNCQIKVWSCSFP